VAEIMRLYLHPACVDVLLVTFVTLVWCWWHYFFLRQLHSTSPVFLFSATWQGTHPYCYVPATTS